MTTLQLRSLASRLWRATPSLTRSINRAAFKPVPPVRDPKLNVLSSPHWQLRYLDSIKSPADFLKAIGRSCETKIQVKSWEDFWKKDRLSLKKDGVSVRDRRYILWCMEKYRLGYPIREFAHELPPKKTIRGWGPKVQNGKRIRSRRIKHKKKIFTKRARSAIRKRTKAVRKLTCEAITKERKEVKRATLGRKIEWTVPTQTTPLET